MHDAALTIDAVDGQFSAMQFGEPSGDDQSQALALLLVMLALELQIGPDLGDLGRGHAPPMIFDRYQIDGGLSAAADSDRRPWLGKFESIATDLFDQFCQIRAR